MSSLKGQSFFLVRLVVVNFFSIANIDCGLQPYYIHFPPPGIPIPNGLEPLEFPYNPWPSSNSTLSRNLNRGGPIPLLVHTWVKPETSEGVKLQNGTIIYYVAPPWGGIRSINPTSASPQATTTFSNALSELDDFSSGGKDIERQSLFQDPNRQSGYPNSVGTKTPIIDITTSPPNRDGSPWGHGHLGFGWPTATQLYDKLPETTTDTNPTRSQISSNSGTTEANSQATLKTTTTQEATTTSSTTTTTPDPIAANTNARFPVSDSVRKFRRIVAQIRAITKQELAAPKSSKT